MVICGDSPGPASRAAIKQSLTPRSSTFLLQVFEELGVKPGDIVLDVGCREADWSIDLTTRTACRVIALDPIPTHIEAARQKVAAANLTGLILPQVGRVEELPSADGSINWIWCRDVFNHVPLPQALAECARVLRPGGAMLVFQTLGTELLEPGELDRLCRALALVPENMACAYFEAEAVGAGFEIVRRELLGSETREYQLESGKHSFDPTLLRLARMRRRHAELVAEYGEAFYEAAYHSELWGVYQMLGKLFKHIHVLLKPLR